MKSCIIVGASHHNTLSVVRCVGEVFGQIDLVLLGCKKSYVAKSKYVRSSTFLDDSNALYKWAKENISSDCPIIISCADDVSQMFDVHFEELHHYYDFFNAGMNGRLTIYMDKQKQVELAKEIGFATPVSSCYKNTDIVSDFKSFPCIVKPLQSYMGGKHVWHCKDIQELQKVVKSAPNGIMFQVQELIKNEHEIVLPGLITKNRLYVPGYILKHRDFLGGTTYSSVKKHNPETALLVSYTEAMLRKIGYEGLFGVEAMYNGNNYVFIELNLRNDATSYSMAVAGVNLPALYIRCITGNDEEVCTNDITEITSMVEISDFSHVLRREVPFFRWIKEFKNSECKYFLDWNDLHPACLAWFTMMTTRVKRFAK